MPEILMRVQCEDVPHFFMTGKKKQYLSINIFYSSVHWAIRTKVVDNAKLYLMSKIKTYPVITTFPVELRITYHSCKKTFDLDNKAGFWSKVFLDLVKTKGVMGDDNVTFINRTTNRFSPLTKGKGDMLEIELIKQD